MVGPPSIGKSILTRLLTAKCRPDRIGVFQAAPDNDKFWLQDLYDKDMYVGEECVLFNRQTDQFKLLLEGHRLCKMERKNKGLVLLPRKPIFITANNDIWSMNVRHKAALLERIFYFDFRQAVKPVVDYHLLYNMSDAEWQECHNKIFGDYYCSALLIVALCSFGPVGSLYIFTWCWLLVVSLLCLIYSPVSPHQVNM